MKIYLIFDDKEKLRNDLCLDINTLASTTYIFFVNYSDRQIILPKKNIIINYVLSDYVLTINENLLKRIKTFYNDNYNILEIIKGEKNE